MDSDDEVRVVDTKKQDVARKVAAVLVPPSTRQVSSSKEQEVAKAMICPVRLPGTISLADTDSNDLGPCKFKTTKGFSTGSKGLDCAAKILKAVKKHGFSKVEKNRSLFLPSMSMYGSMQATTGCLVPSSPRLVKRCLRILDSLLLKWKRVPFPIQIAMATVGKLIMKQLQLPGTG